MKRLLINKNTYIILALSLLTIVSFRLLAGDFESKMRASNEKMNSHNLVSVKINSEKAVATGSKKNSLTSNAFPQTTVANPAYIVNKQSQHITNSAITFSKVNTSPKASQTILSNRNVISTNQASLPETKENNSLISVLMGNDQSSASVYASNTSISNGIQKAKPNGPGALGTLPIGDGVWLLLLFVFGYSLKKMFVRSFQ